MKVFKFGGASVKNAPAIKNLANILRAYNEPLVVVVSAMGKTTNALEKVVEYFFNQDTRISEQLNVVKKFHLTIIEELFPDNHAAFSEFEVLFAEMETKLNEEPSMTYNFEYDQIVSFGELFSTKIIATYLNYTGITTDWMDIRKYLKTDDSYREAKVDFDTSGKLIRKYFHPSKIILTQGFIGATVNNLTTTLGREGSDYTGALLAHFLDAESLTVWKDVPGVLNADPKWFDDTVKLDQLTYSDAIELAFYGTGVLHPKTIQPVKQSNIPLYVKSFLHPEESGSVIGNFEYEKLIPSFIFKMDQILIDVYPPDLSFIAEDNFENIFAVFAKYGLKVNIMQNTAVHFRLCVDNDSSRVPQVINALSERYNITTTKNLELITIRYYDQATIQRVMVNKKMLLEQRTQNTIQMVVKDLSVS